MVQQALQPRALAPAPAVDIRGADFAWKAAGPPLLRGIDLEGKWVGGYLDGIQGS